MGFAAKNILLFLAISLLGIWCISERNHSVSSTAEAQVVVSALVPVAASDVSYSNSETPDEDDNNNNNNSNSFEEELEEQAVAAAALSAPRLLVSASEKHRAKGDDPAQPSMNGLKRPPRT